MPTFDSMKMAEITPVFNYNDAFNKRGEAAIHVRIYYQGKRKLVGLGIHVLPSQWDSKRLRVKSHPSKDQYNNRIKNEINRIRDNEDRLIERRKRYTISDLLEAHEVHDQESFLEWFKQDLSTRVDLAPGTVRQHWVVFRRLEDFKPDIRFAHIDYEFLYGFEQFLRSFTYTKGSVTKKLELTRVVKYLKTLNTYIKRAIKLDMMSERDNPFKRFEWSEYTRAERQADRKRRYLEPEEVQRLENLTFGAKDKHHEKIRDFFIIQCYTGLAYGDMIKLSKANVEYKGTSDNHGLVIRKSREKSGEILYIPVCSMAPKAERILKKYYDQADDYLFDQITSIYINRELKKIARKAGIDKPVTTHVGRHTCAMWLLYNGHTKDIVAKVLGHSDLRSTAIYAEINESVLDETFSKLNRVI